MIVSERDKPHIDLDDESDTLPSVPRPRIERPPTVPMPVLGLGQSDRLRHSREAKGWSLRQLSAAAGVSVRTIREIETGEKEGTSSNIMAALADALHVSRGWLTFGG